MGWWILGWAHLTDFVPWDRGKHPEHPAFTWEEL